MIGYYANARSRRIRGEWRRIIPNALLAGVVTGISLAALLLATKALFFYADNGYPEFNRVQDGVAVGETCATGAGCVYRRYPRPTPTSSRPPASPTPRRSRTCTGAPRGHRPACSWVEPRSRRCSAVSSSASVSSPGRARARSEGGGDRLSARVRAPERILNRPR